MPMGQLMGGIFILWATLGISHIPIHLVLSLNIAQCYAIHQMPPTFAQIKVSTLTLSTAFSIILATISLGLTIIIY